jgi:hypothetical protein
MWYRSSQRALLRGLLENLQAIIAQQDDDDDDDMSIGSGSSGVYGLIDESSEGSSSDVDVPDIDACARKYGDVGYAVEAPDNEDELGVEVD